MDGWRDGRLSPFDGLLRAPTVLINYLIYLYATDLSNKAMKYISELYMHVYRFMLDHNG